MTPAELREHLKKPPVPGKMEAFLRSARGLMSEEEVDDLERRINEMNEWVEGEDEEPA